MAQQQPKMVRVKALKMFKISLEGAVPIMVNPGDVVDADFFLAGMLIKSEKAELTDEKLCINKDYQPPAKPIAAGLDPIGALMRAVESLTKTVGTLVAAKGR